MRAINFIWEAEKRRIWGKKMGEICLDRQKEKHCILLLKTLMSHKMIERWESWFDLICQKMVGNGWVVRGGGSLKKKVSSHRMTKRAHFNECINLPVRSPRKRECRGLNDVRGWGRESRLWENAPVGFSKEKAFSLLLGPARLLSPVTMWGLLRPPAPWLPLLH